MGAPADGWLDYPTAQATQPPGWRRARSAAEAGGAPAEEGVTGAPAASWLGHMTAQATQSPGWRRSQ